MDKLVHFEIPADDVARAQKFYGEVFGWKIAPMPEMNYTIVETGPREEQGQQPPFINGGLMQRKDIKNPVLVMNVANIDEAVKKAQAAGSAIVREKVQVGDMGIVAYVTDSENNVIGLWQALKPA